MASSAHLVTIKRSGDDGAHFPLSLSSCLFGRSIECDIRIQLPVVSKKHCKIEVNGQEAILYNFSSTNPTQVNGATIDEPVQLKHGDIITIIDRSFRYENGNQEDGSSSTGLAGKSPGQEPARRASRASFSVDPDGKGQDAKASKTTVSRRSSVHAKRLPGDSSVSDGSKDSVSQDPSDTCSSGHVEQHSGRSIGEPTSGVLFKKSGATGSSYRELKSSPAQSLSNSKKNDSPFEKLYQSMKEELAIKSQKQSRRKSEPQPECTTGKDTWETKLLVSCKSRPKSSGSTPRTAASSPKVDKIRAETQSHGVGPAETSTEALSSSSPLSETVKIKTPGRNSQLLKNEDLHVTGRRESMNLDESEGAKAGHKTVTPRKLGTKNQTSVKVEDAASPADTPENLSSKKRRRIPAKVEVLSAETQNQFSSQHLAPSEKRTPKNSFRKSEKLATAAEQICSGLPGLSSVDISNFGDSINKSEGMSVKRRRVSFGGRLRPELFDENLPPNTPLKRGETPTRRKSLATHTPAVLKKIIKERPQSPGKQESSGVTPPKANDQRCRSGRSSPASSGSKSLHQTDTPKKAGRKSGNLPAKRASISRSQHDILEMICSKRRSGASEANLIVAKSWADVVKLGTKRTQTKVVKHVPQKQSSKRQRRPNTPKKPTSNLHNQFSTGHANSPCTIVIGRAQIEKVSMPARPYKMLNNLMLNRKMDFSEDLSGLTEMFKTPMKEKQQQMNDVGSILSNSENLPEKQFQVTNSGDKPLPVTSEILEENVLSSTRRAAKEPSDKYSASPILRRRSIKNENTVQTPKNVHNITHLEKKTPGSLTEPLKTASSVSKLRRSRELRHTLVESMHENTEADLAEGIKGRHLRKTSLQGKEVDQQVQDSENSSQRFKENVEFKEDPEKTSAMRSTARERKPTKDIIGSQMITQTAACAEELLNQEIGTTEEPEESMHMHMQNTPICDDQRAKKQKVELVCTTKVKRWSRTPDQKTQPLGGPASLKEPFEAPNCRDKPIGDDKSKVLCKSPQPTTEKTKTSTKTRPSTSGKKVDMKDEQSAIKTIVQVSGGTRHTSKVPELEHGNIKALKEPENQMLDVTVTSTKRPVGKAKEKAQPLEDLAGFQELFLSPVPGDKTTKMPNKSPFPELVRTPASKRRLSKTGLDKVDVREEPSTLGKRTKSPGRAARTPAAPVLEESDTTAFMTTPKQKLDFTENSTGHKRRSRTPKIRAQPLEDLDGFQELFQTPFGVSDPVTVGKITEVPLESQQPEPIRTSASTKRLSKTGLDKVDVREEPSTLEKRASRTPTSPVLEESDTTFFMETPKQKLNFTENSGSKRRSRTPKIRAQPLEDLDGFQELFQTPVGASDPVTVGETTKVSLESPQPEPIRTTASTRRLSKTGLRKVDVREEPSTLGKQTKSPGRAAHTPTAPVLEESDTTAFMETPKQKLDFTENSTGHKRGSRTPKIRAQPVEDLDGFQELFQTPFGASDPVTVGETTKVSLESPQPEPTRTPASSKRLSKTGLDKVDVREKPSTFGKRTKSPGRSAHTPTAPVLEESDITAFMETPKQKLDFTENSGSKRRSRTPKIRAQPLEDLDGFQELFQTPVGASDPVTVGETTKVSLESPQPEPIRTTASTRRLSKTGLRKVDVREEPSTLGKQTKSPGRAAHTPTAPVLEESDTTAFMETPKQKLDFTENSTGHKRRSRTLKIRAQPVEDLDGFQELFQTPFGASDPVTVGETTKVSLESPQPEPTRTPASSKRLSKTGLDKVDVREKPSTFGKRTKSPGRSAHTPTAPVLEESDTTAFMETPKQKLDFTENSGSKRRSRTPKIRAQPLEDLDGFQELFQTPVGASDPVTVGETTKVSLESPQPEPIRTTASTRRLSKTGLRKVDVREEPSTLGKQTKSPGRAAHTPTAPVLEESDTTAFMETPKQKLDFTENSTGHKRRSRTPKIRAQPVEDLDGFQELFQTPFGASDPVTVGETTKVSLESPQPEPTRTPASSKRLSKTGLDKVDVREKPSTFGKRTKSPGRAAHTPTAPVLEESDITAFMETPKQKLDFTENSGSKRRSRTPKIRAQPLEDLDGFQELFQTPVGASDPVTVGETTKVSLESPQPEPIRTTASTRRLSKTGLRKVDVREEPSTFAKQTKSPGRAAHTPTAPVLEESDTTAFMETPKQKLDFTENSTGHKRRSRTPKIRAQPVEDLDGFQELFQTPFGASDPVTVGETTKVSLESPQPEPTRTPASSKRLSKTGLDKVDVREKPSTFGKRTKSPGRAAHTPTAPVLEESDITAFMETPKQKLDFTENSRSKRRSRTPKIKAQPLEDLDGFQELFQTPFGASNPVTVKETTKVSLESPQPEPIRTPASTRRLSKTGLRKVDVREEPLTLGKQTKSPGKATRTPTAPVHQEKRIETIRETSNQKLKSVGNLIRPKKQLRTPKDEGQSLEDLTDCQELFQTPDRGNGPLFVGKTKKMPFNSPQPEPVITLKGIRRQSRASMGQMGMKEELSESEKHPEIEKAIDTLQVPIDNTVIRASKQSAKRKLDPAASVPSSKRLRRSSKDKTPCLQDLSGFQQLFQTPGHAKDSLPIGETLKMPSKSPQSGPVRSQTSRKSMAKTSQRKMDVREELSALWKPSPGKGPITPVQQDNGIQAIMKKSPKEKLETAANVTGLTRQQRAPKEKALPLEDLSGFQELFQTPGYSTDPLIDNKRISVPLKSPQPGLVRTPQTSKRLAKTSLSVREEISSLNMPRRATGEIVHVPRLPEDDGRGNKDLKESRTQILGPSVSVTGSKKQRGARKERSQYPEDLFGLQELFQTPTSHKDSRAVDKTTKMSLESSQPEHFRTPASTKRLSKTGLDKVDVREEPSTLGKRTKSPGRAAHTPTAPVLEESDTTAFMATPKQKLDFTENSTGHKRRSRTPKIRAQPVEDLDGFQELFQTPFGASDPVTVGETTKVSLESPQPEPTRTTASSKRLSKTGLDKVDVREEPSTLGKRTKSPGRSAHTPTAPVLEESDTTAFMETPKQKLDFTENSRSKRRSRTPKIRAQPLEDLNGFQELFQTPVGASDPVTVVETTKVSLESPQPEPIRTTASTRRLSKTGLDKVNVREKLSPLNKPRCSSQEVVHEPRLSEHDGRGAKDVKKSVTQTLGPAVSVTRSKRQRGACKKRSQSPEDLSGLQELFQTPGHDKDSVAGDKLTKMPHRSPSPEPVDTSVTSQRQPRTRLMKVHVKSELSGDRMPPQMSGEIMDISRVPEGEDKGIRTRKQSVKRKLDTAVSVPSSKRQRVAQAEKVQTLEELPSFQEHYQPPNSAVDSMTVDKATKMPSKSPEPMDTTSKTQPGRRLRRAGVTKEPAAQRKTTRVLRETRNTHKEPVGDRIGDKEFKESSLQKQDPAGSLTGKRSQPRTHKEKTQPLEELPSIQEEETATRIACESPQPEEKETSAASKRQLRKRLCKVDVKEEPIAQRKPPDRETRSTLKEPMSDSGNVEELKESTKRKIDPAASVSISKRPRRVPREKTQPLELAGPKTPVQIPGPTEESASDKRLTQISSNTLQPEQVDSLQTSPRRPRTRRGKVEVDEEPSVVRKTVPTSRQTTRSCKVPEIDNKDTQASKEPVKQKIETVANVTGSRRQLRAPKDRIQPLEVLGDSKEITQISEHTEKLRPDTSKSALQQMPDSIKPLRTCRRVLRASKEDTVETMKMSMDTRDPAESQSKSNTFLPPKRKPARDGSISRSRELRSVTTKQEAADEKLVPKTRRAAPSKRQVSPEPMKMKHPRIMSSKIEPVEEQISNIMKTEEKEAPPDQKTPLSFRNQKKTNGKQPRPEVSASAETVGIKKNEKTMKTSQETELQSTDDRAKKSTSRDEVSGKRTCLRSRGQSELPQPHAEEEKTREMEAESLIKTQKKKGVSGDSDVRCLRSKKTGATSDTEPKPRVTRGAKKDTEVPKKDEDIVYTKKLRTRSHQNSKNM